MNAKFNLVLFLVFIIIASFFIGFGCGKKKSDTPAAAAATEEFEIVGAIE